MHLDPRQQRLLAAVVTVVFGVVALYFAFVPYDRPGTGAGFPQHRCTPAIIGAFHSDDSFAINGSFTTQITFPGLCQPEARHRLTQGGLALAIAFVACVGFWRPRWRPHWPPRWPRRSAR
jgi:hypothetical protein